MPYPNEHACRLLPPRAGAPTARKNGEREHEGKKYDVIYQKQANGKWEDQAYRYPKETWSESQAASHCKSHKGIEFEPASGKSAIEGRRLDHVLGLIYDTPHVITLPKLEQVCELLDRRLQSMATVEELAAYPAVPPGAEEESPYQITSGGVAIVRLQGVIAQRIGLAARISGGTSSEQFTSAFNQAVADSAVKAIVIDVNSPGGAYGGTPEAAAAVYAGRKSGKRIVAVANTQMDSGAYWIGSAADEVVASESATLGSIGVYLVHEDTSAADQKAGKKRTVVKAGKWKAIHETPIDPETQAKLQDHVDGIHQLFVEAVALYRGVSTEKVLADFGEGESLLARQAVGASVADRIATLDQVIVELESQVVKTQAGARSPGENAKTTFLQQGAKSMEPKVKAALVAIGLCEPQVSDETAGVILSAWFAGRGQEIPAETPAIIKALFSPASILKAVGMMNEEFAEFKMATPAPTAEEVADKVLAKMRADEEFRVKTVQAQCDLVGLSPEQTAQIANLRLPPDQTTAKIKEIMVDGNGPIPRLIPGSAEKDKWCGLVQEAIDVRFEISSGGDGESAIKKTQPEARQFLNARLCDIAERCLRMEGRDTAGMSRQQVAILALQGGGHAVLSGGGMAYYGTGSFSNRMLNASHKLLVRAYEEAPTTWQLWARRGDPAQDYELHNLIALSAAGNLEETPENEQTPTDTGLKDAREYYQVQKFTRKTGFSYESMVNDQLSALSRVQRMQGTAAARTVNALAYAVLTNGTVALMADGGALFNTTAVTVAGGHANLFGTGSTTAAPPSVATLNILQAGMGIQRDINTETNIPLNLAIGAIIVPMALRGTTLALLRSTADPAGAHEAVENIWRNIIPVVEPLLDAASTACWYVAATSGIDTVVIFHLAGEETPLLESWWDPDRGTRFYKVQQSTAAIPADFRGLAKHVGFSA